ACRRCRPSTPRRPRSPRAKLQAGSLRATPRPAARRQPMTALQATIGNASSAPSALAAPATPAVSAKTWLAVIGATLGAFMAVLNIQIVNASLADIQGAIGAGIDDGGWISTSYLIAEIVVIPLSGWLARVFSVRIYLLTNAVLFLV